MHIAGAGGQYILKQAIVQNTTERILFYLVQ